MGRNPTRTLYEILVRQHHRGLLAYARALSGGDGDLAEELVQDALVKAFERIPDFDQSRDFGAWVRGIVRNLHKQYLSKQLRKAAETAQLADPGTNAETPDPLEAIFASLDQAIGSRSSLLAALETCLQGLTDTISEVVRRFYYHSQSIERIAQDLACSEVAARKRLSRGRQLLFDCLQQRLNSGRWETP